MILRRVALLAILAAMPAAQTAEPQQSLQQLNEYGDDENDELSSWPLTQPQHILAQNRHMRGSAAPRQNTRQLLEEQESNNPHLQLVKNDVDGQHRRHHMMVRHMEEDMYEENTSPPLLLQEQLAQQTLQQHSLSSLRKPQVATLATMEHDWNEEVYLVKDGAMPEASNLDEQKEEIASVDEVLLPRDDSYEHLSRTAIIAIGEEGDGDGKIGETDAEEDDEEDDDDSIDDDDEIADDDNEEKNITGDNRATEQRDLRKIGIAGPRKKQKGGMNNRGGKNGRPRLFQKARQRGQFPDVGGGVGGLRCRDGAYSGAGPRCRPGIHTL